nr:dna-directed rna polymerase iii subunit rpc10 [Quercus suber]
MLIVTPLPAHHTTAATQHFAGQNRFECRTCPYQMVLDKRYFERKTLGVREVEDVLGGSDSWRNVDRTESQSRKPFMPQRNRLES